MWCGKPAKWLTWACIALYRTVNSLIQIWFHHFFTSLALIHFFFRSWLVVPAIKKVVTFLFKGISDFRYVYGLFFVWKFEFLRPLTYCWETSSNFPKNFWTSYSGSFSVRWLNCLGRNKNSNFLQGNIQVLYSNL